LGLHLSSTLAFGATAVSMSICAGGGGGSTTSTTTSIDASVMLDCAALPTSEPFIVASAELSGDIITAQIEHHGTTSGTYEACLENVWYEDASLSSGYGELFVAVTGLGGDATVLQEHTVRFDVYDVFQEHPGVDSFDLYGEFAEE
jgi:hypothetical protein